MRPTLFAAMPTTLDREQIADTYSQKISDLLQTENFLNAAAAGFAKRYNSENIKQLTRHYEFR